MSGTLVRRSTSRKRSFPGVYDGTLLDWSELEGAYRWRALVVGNGLSRNVWPQFDYRSLHHRATSCGLLGMREEKVFTALKTTNFEEVLQALFAAMSVGKAIGEPRPTETELHRTIRDALGRAVQTVHVPRAPDERLRPIRAHMREFRHVFTTSYDLLLYWAAATGPEGFKGVLDFFWANGAHGPNAFDEDRVDPNRDPEYTRLYFLHGALHLVELAGGTTYKRKSAELSLLREYGQPFRGDAAATPLIVSEGNAAAKRAHIDRNAYLSYCWRTLGEYDRPVVVFGQALSDQDAHLVDALNKHRGRAVAIALLPGGREAVKATQLTIASRLTGTHPHFFDATTHPLGNPDLRIEDT